MNVSLLSSMARILREFGEEKYALPIAKKICRVREQKPVETTGELVELVKAAIPPGARYEGGSIKTGGSEKMGIYW